MKRLNIAAVMAAALLLTGCGTAITGSAVAGPNQGAETTESGTTTSQDTTTEDTSTEDTSTEDTSTEDTTTEDTSTEETTTSEDTEPVAVLDEPTSAWFTAFCESVEPLLQVEAIEEEAKAAVSAADLQVIYLENYGSIADGLVEDGTAMSALAAPTVPGGEDAAVAYSSGILDVGTRLNTGLDDFALADPNGDLETFKAAALAALSPVSTDLPPLLTEIDTMKLTVQQQREILDLPACLPVSSFVDGG